MRVWLLLRRDILSRLAETARPYPGKRLVRVLVSEFNRSLPPMLFFVVGFNLIALTQRLILTEQPVQHVSLALVTAAALVVGRSVVIAEKLPFLRCFDRAPLIQPILFKTAMYWAVALVARLLQAYIRYSVDHWRVDVISVPLATYFEWHRFFFVQIWILVLFLIYATGAELNALFGDGELGKILFTRRSTEAKQTRRERIRTLIRLARLTQRHSLTELTDTTSAPHRAVIALITQLAQDRPYRDRGT